MDKTPDTRSRRTTRSLSSTRAPHRRSPFRRTTIRGGSAAHFRDGTSARFAGDVSELTRGQARLFVSLAGTASLAILVQAVIAGQFVSQPGNDGWIFAHGLISYVTLAATLSVAVFALMKLRRVRAVLTALCAGLFILTAVQTVIGYLITVGGQDGWIGLHVPLAFVVFGLTAWLSAKGAAIARATLASRTV